METETRKFPLGKSHNGKFAPKDGRFIWTDEKIGELAELKVAGLSDQDCGERLSEKYKARITSMSVEHARRRYGIMEDQVKNFLIGEDKNIIRFEPPVKPMADYMLSCDYHCPFHSELWINRFLLIAEKFGIRKNIVIGDLFDFDFIKKYPTEEERNLDKEMAGTDPVVKALGFFDKNYLIQGNHEARVSIQTAALIKARHLFGIFGQEAWDKKFEYYAYDRMRIGKEWTLTHPKSYSQISTSVAKRLGEKFSTNIINAHGHFVGQAFDRSGRWLCVDLGGMFDVEKIAYATVRTTTHPFWNNGFGMLLDGKFWHWTDATDWKYWLGRKAK